MRLHNNKFKGSGGITIMLVCLFLSTKSERCIESYKSYKNYFDI